MSSRQSYAVIGTGALGGLYGGLLANHGFDVHFLANSDVEHIRQFGLQVESPLGDFHLKDVNVYSDPHSLPACDVTIVALKSTQNYLLREILPITTRGGGHVLVLQNGLDVEADSVAVVGDDRVLGGCCFLCSNKIGPGHIRHLDYGAIVFGEYRADAYGKPSPGITPRAELIANELQAAKIDAKATDDLLLTRWKKLMWNIPFNGLSVALDASTSEIVGHQHAVILAETIIREVHGAAVALGVPVPEDWIQKQIDATKKMVPYDASMRLDFRHGRPMELEAIFANPIKAAASVVFEMPSVSMLLKQLRFLGDRQLMQQR
jgi:2-dehydropantoate 2-reductase